MNKKPAVVAKTAKKRGRPVGSKAKPKTLSDIKVGQKISAEEFNRLNSKVDWEKLAKQLQAALAAEIKDGDDAQGVIDTLVAELSRKRTFWERLVCLGTGHV